MALPLQKQHCSLTATASSPWDPYTAAETCQNNSKPHSLPEHFSKEKSDISPSPT